MFEMLGVVIMSIYICVIITTEKICVGLYLVVQYNEIIRLNIPTTITHKNLPIRMIIF